jgi:hypothetical protein
MRDPLCFREASKSNLPNVLRLYSQPGMDDGLAGAFEQKLTLCVDKTNRFVKNNELSYP